MYNNPGSPYQQNYPTQQTQQYSQQYQTQPKDKLDNICNFGFAFNHLFTVGLIYRHPKDQNDYKEKHFIFLTLAPAIGSGSNRSYNFNADSKISIKYSLRELLALSFTLKQCAMGNTTVLPYLKFAQSGGENKNVSIWTGQELKNVANTQVNTRTVYLSFLRSQARQTIPLSCADAYSIGEVCDHVFKLGMQLELDFQRNNPKFTTENNGIYSQEAPPTQAFQPNAPPVYSAPVQMNYTPQPQPQPQHQPQFQQTIPTPQQNQAFSVPNQQNFQQPINIPNQSQSNTNPFSTNTNNQNDQIQESVNQFGQILQNNY